MRKGEDGMPKKILLKQPGGLFIVCICVMSGHNRMGNIKQK
jgi:hypothetical protein